MLQTYGWHEALQPELIYCKAAAAIVKKRGMCCLPTVASKGLELFKAVCVGGGGGCGGSVLSAAVPLIHSVVMTGRREVGSLPLRRHTLAQPDPHASPRTAPIFLGYRTCQVFCLYCFLSNLHVALRKCNEQ